MLSKVKSTRRLQKSLQHHKLEKQTRTTAARLLYVHAVSKQVSHLPGDASHSKRKLPPPKSNLPANKSTNHLIPLSQGSQATQKTSWGKFLRYRGTHTARVFDDEMFAFGLLWAKASRNAGKKLAYLVSLGKKDVYEGLKKA